MDSGGPPAWFGGWIAFVVIAGIVSLVVRVALARRFARKAGIDEDAATTAAIFGDGAVTTTYLAANSRLASGATTGDPGHVVADLSGTNAPGDATTPASASAEARIRELEHLHTSGLVTDDEYMTRRQQIIDGI